MKETAGGKPFRPWTASIKDHRWRMRRLRRFGVGLFALMTIAGGFGPGAASNELRQGSHILCLNPGAKPRFLPGDFEEKTWKCLLDDTARTKNPDRQRQLRRCLSKNGVILVPDCHY
jgi:hypothetical protein